MFPKLVTTTQAQSLAQRSESKSQTRKTSDRIRGPQITNLTTYGADAMNKMLC